MTTVTCDGCGKKIDRAHDFMGNISDFGLVDACDSCYDKLKNKGNAELEAFDKEAGAARQKKIDSIVKALQYRVV